MRKPSCCILLFFLTPFVISAQSVDTLKTYQVVDSLLNLSRAVTGKNEFAMALDLTNRAERLSLEKLGRKSIAYAMCVNNRARVYYFQGDYPSSEKWYLETLTVREKLSGKETQEYAQCLNNLALVYVGMKDYDRAEKFHLEARDIRERVLGKSHPDYAQSINNMAIMYASKGDLAKAETLYLEAKTLREQESGKDSPEYCGNLNDLASLYFRMGQYAKAEPLYLEAKDIFENRIDQKFHPYYVNCIQNLGNLYYAMGRFRDAEPFFVQSIVFKRRNFGKAHPQYAAGLENLAMVYMQLGAYEKAEPLYWESLAIREKTPGKNHPDYARGLMGMAGAHYSLGNYELAAPLYRQAKILRGALFGKEHPDYVTSVVALADMYLRMGFYGLAEPLYEEGKKLREKLNGKDDRKYADLLASMATLYAETGALDKAIACAQEVLEARESSGGKSSAGYAAACARLAGLQADAGNTAKAESLWLEAKELFENRLNTPAQAGCLETVDRLADLYLAAGKWQKADNLLQASLRFRETTFGKNSAPYARALERLALVFEGKKDLGHAEATFREALTITENLRGSAYISSLEIQQHLAQFFMRNGMYDKAAAVTIQQAPLWQPAIDAAIRHQSERERWQFQRTLETSLHLTLALERHYRDAELPGIAYNLCLASKGLLNQAPATLDRICRADSLFNERYLRLKGLERRLELLKAATLTNADSALVVTLESRATDLLRSLNRYAAGFEAASRKVTWQDVQQQLKPGEAAVEFVRVEQPDSVWYEALVLRAGTEAPVAVPLFQELEVSPVELFGRVWAPLQTKLAGVSQVYDAPDGMLAALTPTGPADSTTRVDYRLSPLVSTRELAVPPVSKFQGNTVILFGNVALNADSAALARVAVPGLAETGGELDFSTLNAAERPSLNAGLCPPAAAPLSKTLKSNGWQLQSFDGVAATEEAFKTLGSEGRSSPRLVHLSAPVWNLTTPERKGIFSTGAHPLARTGLLLSGSAYAWKTGRPFGPTREDGILTAYEISRMNLSNTELVVLSGCRFGQDAAASREAFSTLHRAFRSAGVRYLLAPVKPVSDQKQTEFLTEFYRYLIENNMDITSAFYAVRREAGNGRASFILLE